MFRRRQVCLTSQYGNLCICNTTGSFSFNSLSVFYVSCDISNLRWRRYHNFTWDNVVLWQETRMFAESLRKCLHVQHFRSSSSASSQTIRIFLQNLFIVKMEQVSQIDETFMWSWRFPMLQHHHTQILKSLIVEPRKVRRSSWISNWRIWQVLLLFGFLSFRLL